MEPERLGEQAPQEPSAGSGIARDEHGRRLIDVPSDLRPVPGTVEADVAMDEPAAMPLPGAPVDLSSEGAVRRVDKPATRGLEPSSGEGEQAAKRVRFTAPPAQNTSPPLLIKRLPSSRRSDVSAPVPLSPGNGAGESSQKGVKRQPEVDVVDLEEEIKTTGPRPLRRFGRNVLGLRCVRDRCLE